MNTTEQVEVYRSCTPVADTRYEADGTRAIVNADADADGVRATDIPPRYEVIDLDAISQLLEEYDGADEVEAILGFTYKNWNVFIRADGRIHVCDGRQYVEPEPVFDDVQA